MVTRILILFIVFISIISCTDRFLDLNLEMKPYSGNQLRIDGYYYANSSSYFAGNYYEVAVFYRNGFCINTHVQFKDIELENRHDTLDYIENKILLNKNLIKNLLNDPTHIGVFEIQENAIEFETWEGREFTFLRYGSILNDTTFVINKRIRHPDGEKFDINFKYRFVEFSPKPDSISPHIK